jgi:hypothetical protein
MVDILRLRLAEPQFQFEICNNANYNVQIVYCDYCKTKFWFTKHLFYVLIYNRISRSIHNLPPYLSYFSALSLGDIPRILS